MKYLERTVEQKKVIWFKESNRYLLVEMPAWEVIKRLAKGDDPKKIARWCNGFYHLPENESKRFVDEVRSLLEQQSVLNDSQLGKISPAVTDFAPLRFSAKKFYSLSHGIFSVEYETEHMEYLLHPKFAHLEIPGRTSCDYCFQVFQYNGNYVLRVNGTTIGLWLPEETHYFTGRFSMELLNRMYNKAVPDWMAVFHASAVSFGQRCVLFLGDSGSGKSTIAAILMSCGFSLLADDFVPVELETGEVFYFPAAVSVKKNALDHILPLYPQLESSAEFYYPGLGKTVRYLAPSVPVGNAGFSYPCTAFVFVKYMPDSGIILEQMPKDIAFQQLVPDSWISSLPESAERFLDWFLEKRCYRLIYSDNAKMVGAVEKLFRDEL